MSDKASNGVKFMLGIKGRMTQIFDDKGAVSAVTVIVAEPMTVTQLKTIEKDGYQAVQVGSGTRKESRVAAPAKGPLKAPPLARHIQEFRTTDAFERGATIDVISRAEFLD